jgi:hypothetical protein
VAEQRAYDVLLLRPGAPALRSRAAEVDREVDPDRNAHAADRRQHREHEALPLAKVAEVELAPRLKTLVGYVAGKPLGVVGMALIVAWLSRGRLRPTVGWGAVAGAGASAGVGFTVSLLVAALAFDGAELEKAKAGILAAAVGAAALTWLVFRTIGLLSQRRRIAALLGGAEPLLDLEFPVDPESDHIRGPLDAPVTVVEYGDFECPYCGRAEPAVRELLSDFGDVRYVWRHLPLTDVHPHAQLTAEASEAATDQGAFWEMHDLLLEHQDALRPPDLIS